MKDLDRYGMDGSDTNRRRGGPGPAVIGVVVVIVVAVTAYLLTRSEPAPPPLEQTETEAPAPRPEPLPALGEEAAGEALPLELPALDDSDGIVAGLVEELTSQPTLVGLLLPDRLVRRFVATVDNIADGVHPRPHFGTRRLDRPFQVREADGVNTADGRNSGRYDPWVDAFTSIDPQGAATLYHQLEPLLGEAYRDLGYPNRRFDDALLRACRHLLETPIPMVEPELAPKVRSWAYADDRLESLSPVQKQLLRLGPDNQRRVDTQLRKLAAALGIPADRLPATPVYDRE